jgi:two-component system CheB/CheR fusion protein
VEFIQGDSMTLRKKKEKIQKPSHYVGIGASAGGLEAIEAFFKNMPPKSNLAFIVVQHLSPDYKSLMVELLSKKTEMPVHRAEDGMEVLADNVYLIPPKKNLTIFHGKLLLNDKVANQGINLPIDIFLRSLAEDQGERTIAIILSGTGSDGTRGVRAIKEFGGMVMVQDEESAKFDGMPRAAVSTGVADFIMPPEKMPEQLLAYMAHPYVSGNKHSDILLKDPDALTRLFAELREKTKADFTYYKPSTITRRIERRMSVNQISDFEEYVKYLQSYPGEVMALYRDLLIGVTSFFRDPDPMQELEEKWLPELLMRVKNREIRFWVAGCSTGEEAYTLAILVKEAMEKAGISRDVKIFATDIDKDAVITASSGIYPESIAGDLPPKIMAKYFYHKEEKLQIARHLREMVVFAQHNLVKDPPFTNIDFITCRNLLIYLQPILQQKVFEMFNFSLNSEGLLFLGSSETIGEMGDFFETMHQKHKIYRSKGKIQPLNREVQVRSREDRSSPSRPFTVGNRDRRQTDHDGSKIIKQYLQVVTEQYLPLSVIVNERLAIVHIFGNTEGYFKIPSGPMEYDITKMAAGEMAIPLATGIQKVFRSGEAITSTNIRLQQRDLNRTIRLRILPLPAAKGCEPLVTVFFEEISKRPISEQDTVATFNVGEEAQQRINDLEQELQFARENLQATIEELETSNEELQATNEELLASNEELQSTNEELQSTNEELYTVNAEHQNKIIELTELNNDVDNLLTSSRIGTLLLDEDLEIRKFSPEIGNIFHILEKDIGRPVTHLNHNLQNVNPIEMIRTVQKSNRLIEKEVQAEDGRWYLARILPYAIGPKAYSGVVLTFVDISETITARDNLASSRQTTLDISQFIPAGLFVYRENSEGALVLDSCNPEAERMTGISMAQCGGKRFEDIWPRADKLIEKFIGVMKTGQTCYLEDVYYKDERIEGAYRIHAFRLLDRRLAVSFEDITERKIIRKELEESERKYRVLFETMAQGVVFQDRDGRIISANPAAERILGLTFDQMRGATSLDARWRTIREDGSPLPGAEHPAMVALQTGTPVYGFVMGVYSPAFLGNRWILVNAGPQFHEGEKQPYQVYATFEDITERYNLYSSAEKKCV